MTRQPEKDITSLTFVAHKVETILREYCQRQLLLARHPSQVRTWKTLETVITGGGKRLRPYIFITAYSLGGEQPDDAVFAVAAAWEMLHQCMLIHDDVIDRDFVRHGQANMNGLYREYYDEDGVLPVDRDHYANSAAIIGGDLALSAAYELILESSLDDARARLACNFLRQSIHEVALGELQDTESAFNVTTADDALMIAEMKTASYSFVGPITSGAALAELPTAAVEALGKFGKSLGIAFQFRDDVLSLFGDEAKTGKSTESDIREGKQTLLIHYTREHADDSQLKILQATLGNHNATSQEIEKCKSMIRDVGALARVEAEIACFTEGAENALAALTDYPDGVKKLDTLANRLLERQG